ncbi:hypothetical protein F4556_003473 [Kitasatospora gansuensis]|uniref:Secreted protein n=1 Tax=Kitasatospora gansuensis TaxID=258050 RepID=A0A7W7WI80_9ACTN|nr:hypothetical protein [Kitasatospora gansuensis]MBB4947938.1 hypothetical protein [Kitasatospora gansuensis]
MALEDQLPALVGVVVGAVGSYVAAHFTERSRWRRARAERWDEKRFHTYMTYANTLKAQLRVAQRIGAARGFQNVADPLEPDEGLALLADAESRRASEWEAVLLVGDAETIGAARAWHEAVWNLELYARGMREDPAGWSRAYGQISQARDAFYACARRDLGITGPPPPSGRWPRPWQQPDLS